MLATRIWPPVAAAHRRCASVTGRPYQSSSSKVASPTLIPTRIDSGSAPCRLSRSTTCCICTAPVIASAAPLYVTMIASAGRLDLFPTGARDDRTEQLEVAPSKVVGRPVADALGQRGRADQIGEQHSDEPRLSHDGSSQRGHISDRSSGDVRAAVVVDGREPLGASVVGGGSAPGSGGRGYLGQVIAGFFQRWMAGPHSSLVRKPRTPYQIGHGEQQRGERHAREEVHAEERLDRAVLEGGEPKSAAGEQVGAPHERTRPKTRRNVSEERTKSGNGYISSAKVPASGRPIATETTKASP